MRKSNRFRKYFLQKRSHFLIICLYFFDDMERINYWKTFNFYFDTPVPVVCMVYLSFAKSVKLNCPSMMNLQNFLKGTYPASGLHVYSHCSPQPKFRMCREGTILADQLTTSKAYGHSLL